MNTIVGDKAHVDFDKPFDLGKPGSEAAQVVHAEIEGRVRLRDDKGTSQNPGDDLTIGPLTHLEYDAVKNQIRSSSDIELRQEGTVVTATGLVGDLRTSEPAPGASRVPSPVSPASRRSC